MSKLASTGVAFEPFRNPVSADEIRSCEAKLFDLHSELNRQTKRQQQPKQDESLLPMLWILTPTLAAATLDSFGAITDVSGWGKGVYFFPPGQKTGIVVITNYQRLPIPSGYESSVNRRYSNEPLTRLINSIPIVPTDKMHSNYLQI